MRYFAPVALSSFVMAAILVIVMPQVQSQQTSKEQEQNEKQPSDLQTNSQPQVDQSGQQQGQSGTEDKENNKCPTKGVWEWFLQFSASNDKAIVAISTIVIATFTALLFVATILLWWGGERHSRRELRAYLSVKPKLLLDWSVEQHPGVDCVIKNHGQTPAFEINYVFEVGIFIAGFNLPVATRVQNRYDALFPNDDVSTRFFSAQTFTENQLLSVEAGTHRFYVWGIMSFVDSFKKRRRIQFSTSLGGPDFAGHMTAIRANNPNPPAFRWIYGERHNSEI